MRSLTGRCGIVQAGALAALVGLAGSPFATGVPAPAHPDAALAPIAVGAAGSVTPVARWQIQSSSKAPETGAEISTDRYAPKEWFPVSGRATVMAGLIENGTYKDIFYGDNLRAASEPDSSGVVFVVPWWYRTQFRLDDAPGLHTALRVNGMIAGADVWVNGQQVADAGQIAGAYPVREIDVTRWVHPGTNTLALRVHHADPRMSLSIGWVDWNPTPPDDNMGPWRGVDILRSGPVQLRFPEASPALSADLSHAALTVRIEVRNIDSVAHEAVVSGVAAGVPMQRTVHLRPGETQTLSFAPATDAGLELRHPKVWWPIGLGSQPLYTLELAATVDGQRSDTTGTNFGVRSVSSHFTRDGYLQFVVNGKPLLIRGGGWAPDLFLRADAKRQEAEFDYVANLGLNTIRLEGKLEDEHFYELADQKGILILPGWECCDKWESWAKTGGAPWDARDGQVAVDSMASEARLLRNHPAVIGFLIGSDNAPPTAIATRYVETLRAANWSLPVVAAAVDQGTSVTGPSGMKMTGPYSWVPPNYWYADQLGGAFGFDSEVSAGASIPRLEDLARMLAPRELDALWKEPAARQYHASAAWSVFSTLEPFDLALAQRYGAPKNLADYVAKAQLDNYDSARAQFEAFNAHQSAAKPATGVIYWMLNNAWPSLHWHLYDYFLNPAGAYFGAKKANEPLHIQYSYETHGIVLVNQTLTHPRGLTARIRVRNLDGAVAYDRQLPNLDLPGNGARQVATLPELHGLSRTFFLELELTDAQRHPLSRNVYWLSTQADVLDWAHSNWYLTPVSQAADFTALQTLPAGSSELSATVQHDGAQDVVTVTLTVPADATAPAVFQHVTLRPAGDGPPIVPILWSDNDVTLWPGESITLVARVAQGAAGAPVVEVSGWNVPTRRVPVGS